MNFRVLTSLTVSAVAAGAAFGQVLNLQPPPSNNGGSANWGMFLDLRAVTDPICVTHLKTANTGAAGAAFSLDVYTFVGSGLGGPVGSGPGSSPTGWTLLGNAPGIQGPLGATNGVSELIDIPDIFVPGGQTVGVALVFRTLGPRYFGTGTPALSVFDDGVLRATTGDVRSVPFTATGSFFSSRAMVGELHYYVVPEPASMAALALGAGLLALRRRRKV